MNKYVKLLLIASLIFIVLIAVSSLWYYSTNNPIPSSLFSKGSALDLPSIANTNPELVNNGEGWLTQNNPNFLGITSANTRFCNEIGQGFILQVKVGLPVNLMFAITHTEFGIGEPYEHPNPIDPNTWQGDTLVLAKHDFYIDSAIVDWNVAQNGYFAYGFGGWIILDSPYTIHVNYAGENVTYQSRIFEVLIALRGDDIVQEGGESWTRIWYRTGDKGPRDPGWIILQYIMSKQPVGEWQLGHLTADLFSKLVMSLEQTLTEKNPYPTIFHAVQNTISAPDLYVDGVKLENGHFRLAFVYLEGGCDFGSFGFGGAKVIVRRFYHTCK